MHYLADNVNHPSNNYLHLKNRLLIQLSGGDRKTSLEKKSSFEKTKGFHLKRLRLTDVIIS